MFARGSRYETVPTGAFTDPDGKQIPYKLLRLLPDPVAVQTYPIRQGDRLDLLAYQAYRDPEQFWRLCDANHTLWPDDLTSTLGRRLRIPLAQR